MITYTTGCLVCSKPLKYFNPAKEFRCKICSEIFESNTTCEEGHFICDKCHTQKGFMYITDYTINTASQKPVSIATNIMKNEFINMHGPEHHYMVTASLLAAYKNSCGKIDLKEYLAIALQRSKNVPGGICGLWGSCGAGIGAGIFVSVVTGATPLSEHEWSIANLITSQCLKDISQNGGPRCCKRNTYLSLLRAIIFVKEYLSIQMHTSTNLKCIFFNRNSTCKKNDCLFYPK